MIIIVGAGLAGLSAAYKLLHDAKLNPDDLLILEARDRVGGRIESAHFDDGSRVDLGAQWLHGERNNPIYNWLVSLGCIEGPEEEESEFEGLFSTPSGHIPTRDVVNRVLDLLMEAKSFLYKVAHTIDKHARPVDIYRNYIESEACKCQILKDADGDLIRAVERWFELYEMIDNSCEDMSLLSIKAYSDWTDFDEGKMMLLKGGWQGVVNKLIDMIGINRVHLRHIVKQIRFGELGVEVVVSDDKNDQKNFKCDHVIVTCSIGVLKTIKSNFFVPSIEESKSSRLRKFGFGVANKIFLQFSEPFLHEEKGLKLLWPGSWADDFSEIHGLPIWTKYITGFDLVSGAPNLLLGWIGGRGATLIETESNQNVARVCLRIFEIFIPNKKVPPLISAVRSAWASNTHIRGAYSYPSVESADDEVDDLWEPLCSLQSAQDKSETKESVPRVLFAGEATAKNMYATAHGAIMSGWREANRIMNLMKND